jgi:effector-binding domain-containing protein
MKTAIIIIGAILVLIAIFVAYYGGFKKVDCRIEEQGGETLAYKEMKGDYSKSGKLMDQIYYALLNDHGIETYKGFGIYYDNPRETEKSKLRSEVGCIVEEKDQPKVAQLEEQFKIKTHPPKSYIVTEFPYKGKMSVLFGMMKVYPALNTFVEKNGYNKDGAVMEIYDVPNKKIVYRKEMLN